VLYVAVLTVTGKVALACPAGTCTEEGIVTSVALFVVSETFAPLAGAGALNVTVPVLLDPLPTIAGENETPRTHAAVVIVAAVKARFAVTA
jgi:hypothetical protein